MAEHVLGLGGIRACGAVFRIGEQRLCVKKKAGQSG